MPLSLLYSCHWVSVPVELSATFEVGGETTRTNLLRWPMLKKNLLIALVKVGKASLIQGD